MYSRIDVSDEIVRIDLDRIDRPERSLLSFHFARNEEKLEKYHPVPENYRTDPVEIWDPYT